MNNSIKFIEKILDGKMKNNMKNDGVTFSEKVGAQKEYTKEQARKDLENYKIYLNSFAFDGLKDVKVLAYCGDEEI